MTRDRGLRILRYQRRASATYLVSTPLGRSLTRWRRVSVLAAAIATLLLAAPGWSFEPCCDPALEPGVGENPPCIEGRACVPTGEWICSIGDGLTFPDGSGGVIKIGVDEFGEVCPVPPLPAVSSWGWPSLAGALIVGMAWFTTRRRESTSW